MIKLNGVIIIGGKAPIVELDSGKCEEGEGGIELTKNLFFYGITSLGGKGGY